MGSSPCLLSGKPLRNRCRVRLSNVMNTRVQRLGLSENGKRWTTLVGCFLHFDFSFMLWVLFGALGIPLCEAARLSPAQKGLVVAVPILAGSLLRVPIGMSTDRFGGKRVGAALLAFLFVPLALARTVSPSLGSLLLTGALLGVAGASFAVAL